MCGRFSLRVEMDELMGYFGLFPSDFDYMPRYNIAPGQMIPAVIEAKGVRKLGPLRWGLVPSWAKDEKIGYMMINARAETLTEKPSFKRPLASKRCIIPADGFYEWRKADKQPFRITMADQSLFAMAALYDTWISPTGEKLSTCTIITTEPNALMEPIHDRMPAILTPEQLDIWLNKDISDPAALLPLLQPFAPELMYAYTVSPIVGNVKNDVPECLDPYTPEIDGDSPVQMELF